MIRRLLLLDHPQETRFFLFVGAFGVALATIYWFVTYEVAGTVLLLGFGAGAGLLGAGLYRSRPRAVREGTADAAGVHAQPSQDRGDDGDATPLAQVTGFTDKDVPGGGAGGVDTPFSTPLGRLPGETLAPLALGLGMALALTAVVFGPWLLVAGLLPLAWGGWTWLTAARDELRAVVRYETQPVAVADPTAAASVTGTTASPRDAADSARDPA